MSSDDKPAAWLRDNGKECTTAASKAYMESCGFGHWAEIAKSYNTPLYTRPAATSNEAARDAILSAVTKFNELLIVELFTGRENKATRSDMRNLAKTFNPEYWGISAAPPAPTGEAVQPDAVVVDNLSIGDDPDFVEVARTYRKSPTGASYRAMCAYIDARPAASGAGAPPAATPALLGLSLQDITKAIHSAGVLAADSSHYAVADAIIAALKEAS